MTEVDVAVVGCGIMGAAAGWWLARSGAEVALLERFAVGHAHGSSHGSSRIFRYSYPDVDHVRMAQEALPLWRELEAETGDALLVTTGGLDTGEGVDDRVRALAACGAAFELLDAGAASRRFPRLSLAAGAAAVHQPDGAVILAGRAWRALAGAAVARGARLHEHTEVLGLVPGGGGVEVRTGGATLRARVAVVTAGAWARPLLAGAGIDLPTVVTRETVAYFGIADELTLPTLVDWAAGSLYALPSPGEGIKAGVHLATRAVDPDTEAAVDPACLERIRAWVAARYPSADPEPLRAETCLYTNTADQRFILERRGPVVAGSACSGHGFKFAPLIGRRLAELALRDGDA